MEPSFWAIIGVIITLCIIAWRVRGYINGATNKLDSIAKGVQDIRDRTFTLIENLADRQGGLLEHIIKSYPIGKNNPLTPEKAQRRDELMAQGRTIGLNQTEADELEALLREEAFERFAAGSLALLAFLALAATVIALFSSKGKQS